MQKKATFLLVGFFVLIAALLIAILAVLSTNTSDNNNNNCSELTAETEEDLKPKKDSNGKYEQVAFTEDQLNRIMVVHFNVDKLYTPLFLCPIEKYIDLNPDVELMVFTPNSTLIEENLAQQNQSQIVYYDYKDLGILFSGLPIEFLYTEEVYKENAEWANTILTDLIRWAAIYKYGGIYSDLDVIPNRMYKDDEVGFVVSEDNLRVGSAYFRFPKRSPILWLIMQRVADHHPIDEWGSFGPLPITEILHEHCGIVYDSEKRSWTSPTENLDSECANIKTLPLDAIFPIHWVDADQYTEPYDQLPDQVKTRVENALGLHWWNFVKSKGCLNGNSTLAYLAKRACPGIYEKHEKTLICGKK